MYLIDRIVKDLEMALEAAPIDPALRPVSTMLHLAWAFEAARRAAGDLKNVECGTTSETDRERKGFPTWSIDVPSAVTLTCPRCKQTVECDTEFFDTNRYDGSRTASATISDQDFCEDCGICLCPNCPRFPHPDDKDLIQCEECHNA